MTRPTPKAVLLVLGLLAAAAGCETFGGYGSDYCDVCVVDAVTGQPLPDAVILHTTELDSYHVAPQVYTEVGIVGVDHRGMARIPRPHHPDARFSRMHLKVTEGHHRTTETTVTRSGGRAQVRMEPLQGPTSGRHGR